MPRSEEQNQQIRDERREQLLKAALKVFAQKGLSAAKISDIAAAAGLSHGLIYHYFKSKDEIFACLAEQAMETSGGLAAYAYQIPGSPWDRIKWMTEALVSGLSREGNHSYYFLIMLQAFTSDAVPQRVKELTAKPPLTMEYLTRMIVEGQQEGQVIQEDPESLAVAYWSLVQGLSLMMVEGGKNYPFPEANVILRLLKA